MEPLNKVSEDRKAMPIKALFSFKGRINRTSFWLTWFGLFGALLVFYFPYRLGYAKLPFFLAIIPGLWIGIAMQVKRWHDMGRSGLFFFINFLPYIGTVISLICLGFIPGAKGANKYGDISQ